MDAVAADFISSGASIRINTRERVEIALKQHLMHKLYHKLNNAQQIAESDENSLADEKGSVGEKTLLEESEAALLATEAIKKSKERTIKMSIIAENMRCK